MSWVDVAVIVGSINTAVLLPLFRWVIRVEARLSRIETMLTETKNGTQT